MHTSKTPWGHVLALVLGLGTLVSVALLTFAWPAVNVAPRAVPVALSAPAPVAAELTRTLDGVAPGAFAVTAADDRAAAVDLVEGRHVYGGLVAGPQGAEVLVASAAGPAVAQLLTDVAERLGEAQQRPVQVTDVAPLPDDDPRGVGLAAGALPLVLGGIATASALRLRVPEPTRRVGGVLGAGAVGGIAMVAILQWLGVVSGAFWANVAVVALAITATAAALLGLERLAGLPAMALGGATVLLLGNSLSGLTSAPVLLPTGWGALGQLLPPGAAATALRSTAYFDGAGATAPLLVLAAWSVLGLALMVLPVRRRRADVPAATPAPEPSTAGGR
ncbi:hypothetical protein [Georgenia ruanii]|uniref:hypothetical protein n=1 Tax=Georgenia ruanii TaxID=348442 RepID=UPI0012656A24|nr:hypothetical protein [Georgenia ruanii]